MGGRGASSGISDKGKKYGSEYATLYQSGNVKFVSLNQGATTPPMETMTKGRVYVTIDKNRNIPKHITYYDKDNKRVKQIDMYPSHKGMAPHTHHGYVHNENDSEKGAARPTPSERKMVERINKIWYNHVNNK